MYVKVGVEGKSKEVAEVDKVPTPYLVLEQETFIKALKALSVKSLEGVPLFTSKMEVEVVVEWIEGMENHFECEGITEAQKVKVAKSRMRGTTLTWWKFIQDERKKIGKEPISSWKGMLVKIKETYFPQDYEVQIHRKRQNLRQKELDVSSHMEEFQKHSLRSQVVEEESLKVARYLNGLR